MSSEEGPEAPEVHGVEALANLAQSDVVVAPREVAVAASGATQDLVRIVSAMGVMTHKGITALQENVKETKEDVKEVKEDVKEVKGDMVDLKEQLARLQKANEENNSPYARFFDTEQQRKVSFDSTSHHD